MYNTYTIKVYEESMTPNDRYCRNVKNIIHEIFLLQSYLMMAVTGGTRISARCPFE